MTIGEAIQQVDRLVKNTIKEEDKVKWLSRLDSRIMRDVIKTSEVSVSYDWKPYGETTDKSTTLLAQEPYDQLYLLYLQSQIHFYMQEYSQFNDVILSFDKLFQEFKDDWNRHHEPLKCHMIFF